MTQRRPLRSPIVPQALKRPYDPTPVEAKWYREWEQRGCFAPSDTGEPFVISMPPPNLTGALHYGHTVFIAFQDLVIRWRRMQGYSALWLPGTDHAAIATNAVLLDRLAKEGKRREDVGREGFERLFWEWIDSSGNTIRSQLRRTGASCDWSRERFTMDVGLSKAVTEAFVRLYERGLIYRGTYLINWDPQDRTAVSDLEVNYDTVLGKLWYVRYPLKGGGHVTVATTRPETILGDTAIAVHPDDRRYRAHLKRTAIVPAIGREIPFVADSAVDPEFGTGAVKVTPGHDPNDYGMALRHDLPMINILNEDGTLNENAGPFSGQEREVARRNMVEFLDREGLIEKVEDHEHSLGHGQRSGAVIEPMLSEQWFVKAKPLAEKAARAVRSGEISFYPRRFADEFLRWMDEIHDWCISRQIWVGHRMPVWYCRDCGETLVLREEPQRCPHCGGEVDRDPDVLDTWFSSGLWPFSTLGWPDDTYDMRRFYPTTLMETGYDILFFWVARMAMLGLELTGKAPFRHVYLNGLMRHEDGSKVSKSDPRAGDDPVEVFDEFGADAVRFMIATGSSPGNDMRLVWQKLDAARNFANKLWNAARFTLEAQLADGVVPAKPTAVDRWILGRLDRAVQESTRLLDAYLFGEAGRAIHDFIWSELCDWYIEASKARLNGEDRAAAARAAATLAEALGVSLRLLHPFMPFLTEEIWSHLRQTVLTTGPELLINAPWPVDLGRSSDIAVEGVESLVEAVRSVRNARHEARVEPGKWIEALLRPGARRELLEAEASFVTRLARVDPLKLMEDGDTSPERAVALLAGGMEIYLPLEGFVDAGAERARLRKEIDALESEITRAEALLANRDFVGRAPEHVVQAQRDRKLKAEEQIATLADRLSGL